MTEYRYNWKQVGDVWKEVPAGPCPECNRESFTTLIDLRPRSLVPLVEEYKKTVECLECGYREHEEILSEESFKQLAQEEDIPI